MTISVEPFSSEPGVCAVSRCQSSSGFDSQFAQLSRVG